MQTQKHDPSNWPKRFEYSWADGLPEILKRHRENHSLFEWISEDLKADERFFEVGSGRGYNTIILKMLNCQSRFTLSDYLVENLEIIKAGLSKSGLNQNWFSYERFDVLNDQLPADTAVAFSDGVLEHFSPQEIVRAIRNQKLAKVLFFVVPVNNADLDYGDEIILPHKKWMDFINEAYDGRAQISALPIGHKGFFFRFLRKLVPPFKKSGNTAGLTRQINRFLLGLELRRAATICYRIVYR